MRFTAAAALVAALALFAAACGGSTPSPDKTKTASPRPTVTHLASLVNRDFGLALAYDPEHYELQAATQPSLLALGPSPLAAPSGSQSDLSMSTQVPTLSVAFHQTGASASASATPSFTPSPTASGVPSALTVTSLDQAPITIDVQDLPFKSPRPANGLYRSALEQLQTQMDSAWSETFMDPHQTYFLDQGDVPAWVVEAGGLDAHKRAMHVRLTVAATTGRLYLISVVLPADGWSAESKYIEQVLTGLKLLRDGKSSRAGVLAVDDGYKFTVARPHDFVQIQASTSNGERLYTTDVSSIGGDLTTAYAVSVAAATAGVGSQAGLLESVYRQTAASLSKQQGVIKVLAPRREQIGGQTAWVIDYTHQVADGVLLRTRLYDIWSGDYIYTLAVQGSAETWGLAWRALEPVVRSFRTG